ncbi:putative tetratricopeptide-like helical domain superfamily [Helianthus annuus]|nr:putative tetratricopeptide-like helical domain superfamily [Helianthus annuus]KAJ0638790.1 putative tetratricopeptide-like helical domain superfamily [Helianthus annuus]
MLKLVYWSVHANCLMKVLNGGDDATSTLLWNVLINGYCKVGKWGKAVELFKVMPEKYGSTWSTLINGLMKAGEIDRAMELWRSVEERDVVSWTTMINGFSQNGQHEQALSMFFEMLEEGVKPNDQTIVCALLACAKAGALATGTRIHGCFVEKDLRTWSVMIRGCAINGYLDKALDCFNKMKSTGTRLTPVFRFFFLIF